MRQFSQPFAKESIDLLGGESLANALGGREFCAGKQPVIQRFKGDAFLAQQKEVMDAVQRLRSKAKESGNLKSSKEQTVKTEPAPAGAPAPQIIVIESSSPEVVYVPTYNPTVVYGAWPYPAYPPYYYYPPAYVPGAAFFTFSAGVIVGGAI